MRKSIRGCNRCSCKGGEEMKKKKMDFDDEICQCGHSKGYHLPHELDKHGKECEICDCLVYTWKTFVKYKNI